MDDVTSKVLKSFSQFLSGLETKIKEKGNSSLLASFASPLTGYAFKEKLGVLKKHFERSFYFEKPSDGIAFLGLDEVVVVSENGEGRFAATDKKTREWKVNFVNNWDDFSLEKIPLFLGGMKFSTGHNDDEWQDFDDSSWFIPEILLLYKKDEQFLFYNSVFSPNTSKDSLIKKFTSKLDKLKNLDSASVQNTAPKILSSEGNSPKDKKKWKNLVSEGLEKINENQLEKIVLSRKVELKLSDSPDFNFIITKLRKLYPECYLFNFHRGRSSFFGATPEKLAAFSKGMVEIDALAGSAPRGKTTDEDILLEKELLSDKKNLNEHNIVIDYIKSALTRFSDKVNLENKYSIKKLANIQHIWTKISAGLNSKNIIFILLKELYPTPAICGTPKETALHLIKKMEGYKRGLYSGIIGWFNFEDEGEFAVALRSALYTSNKLIAYAGCGIVPDSDPELEYKETELKLKTIMSLFADENKN